MHPKVRKVRSKRSRSWLIPCCLGFVCATWDAKELNCGHRWASHAKDPRCTLNALGDTGLACGDHKGTIRSSGEITSSEITSLRLRLIEMATGTSVVEFLSSRQLFLDWTLCGSCPCPSPLSNACPPPCALFAQLRFYSRGVLYKGLPCYQHPARFFPPPTLWPLLR